MNTKDLKRGAKKVWRFIWESNSPWSWLANIILAFILIKFLVYPVLGFAFQTTHPIVAVVSGSMEHKTVNPCLESDRFGHCTVYQTNSFGICGKTFSTNQDVNLDFYWNTCGDWYQKNQAITKEQFSDFRMSGGFNTGDIIVLRGEKPENIKIGDIIVYSTSVRPDPIIHRVIRVKQADGSYYFGTKGDHNDQSYFFEQNIPSSAIVGKAWVRLPYLGYVKIWFVRLLEFSGLIDFVQWIRG